MSPTALPAEPASLAVRAFARAITVVVAVMVVGAHFLVSLLQPSWDWLAWVAALAYLVVLWVHPGRWFLRLRVEADAGGGKPLPHPNSTDYTSSGTPDDFFTGRMSYQWAIGEHRYRTSQARVAQAIFRCLPIPFVIGWLLLCMSLGSGTPGQGGGRGNGGAAFAAGQSMGNVLLMAGGLAVILGVSYLGSLFALGPRRQTLLDMLAGAVVIDTRKKSSRAGVADLRSVLQLNPPPSDTPHERT